jgi:Smr domain
MHATTAASRIVPTASSATITASSSATWNGGGGGNNSNGHQKASHGQNKNHANRQAHVSTNALQKEAIDAYAQRLLENAARRTQLQPSSVHVEQQNDNAALCLVSIDESLGPYVTSCLRNSNRVVVSNVHHHSNISNQQFDPFYSSNHHYSTSAATAAAAADHERTTDVTQLADYECLCELIQEHCQIENDSVIQHVLQDIANAVFHSIFVSLDTAASALPVDTMQASRVFAEDATLRAQDSHVLSTETTTATATAASKLQDAGFRTEFSALSISTNTAPNRVAIPGTTLESKPPQLTSTSLSTSPPLSTVDESCHSLPLSTVPATTPLDASGSTSAALPTTASPLPTLDAPLHVPYDNSHTATSGVPPAVVDAHQQQQQQEYYEEWFRQEQYPVVAQYVHSLYPDVSEDAVWAATMMANGVWNVAAHLVECATMQLPLCRNLSTHGRCYRADCSFGHDIESHTCVFWLKGTCTKGAAQCKFRHGFSEEHLETAPEPDEDTTALWPSTDTSQDAAAYYQHHHTNLERPTSTKTSSSSSSLWIPSPPPTHGGSIVPAATETVTVPNHASSFANIASRGFNPHSFVDTSSSFRTTVATPLPTVRIPQEVWNAHERRDANAFYIADPLERYHVVAATTSRADVMDLHFQSLQTFAIVLETILPSKLQQYSAVWIVTGTGHHVGTKTHQKGGGALEAAVLDYLQSEASPLRHLIASGYTVSQGRDRNGQGGALQVQSTSGQRIPK